MAQEKELKIPEGMINEVRAQSTQFNDLKKQAAALIRKLERTHKKMWWSIEDALPETAEGNWKLDVKAGTVKRNEGGGMPQFLKDILRGATGHQPPRRGGLPRATFQRRGLSRAGLDNLRGGRRHRRLSRDRPPE